MEQVKQIAVNGHLGDGKPYSGVLIKTPIAAIGLDIMLSKFHKKSLSTYIKHNIRRTKHNVFLSWTGIKVLDEKTARENYLPDSFHGCPQGLLINEGVVVNPPLYNKPALILDKEGKLKIENLNTKKGIRLSCRSHRIEMDARYRNIDAEKNELPDFCFYDLLYDKDYIYANGRVIVQMGGNLIKEIIFSRPGQKIPLQSSGITLSVDDDAFPPTWDMREKELELSLMEWDNIEQAIEMGPMILNDGLPYLALDSEGWLSKHSMILTPAERIAKTFDCSGAAAGIDKDGNFVIFALLSDDKQPVKVPCVEMAIILEKNQISKALSFAPDWQGSIMLGEEFIINTIFDNQNEDNNLFPVSCAVMCYQKEK